MCSGGRSVADDCALSVDESETDEGTRRDEPAVEDAR